MDIFIAIKNNFVYNSDDSSKPRESAIIKLRE